MKISKKRLQEIVLEEMENLSKGNLDEAGSIGGAIDMSSMHDSWISPKRDNSDSKNQGVFLQKFSSNEARSIIDGQLKQMAQDLRKVQGRVVKDWMSAAKSGVVDYFDLVRGLETGDIARAHPYETKFFKAMLDKDKIMNRFRSYFKGKKGKPGRAK